MNEEGALTGNLHNSYEVAFDLSKSVDLTTGTYYINVTSVDASDLDESGMSYTFHIGYSIGAHMKKLIDGVPSHGSVKPSFYSYFEYYYEPKDEDIVIRLTTLAGDPDVFMSIDLNAKYTTRDNS